MGKNKLLRILQWGWWGIRVWSVLISLGVPAVIRAVFHSIFSAWTWYDQILLFVGIGLIILGILAAIRGRSQMKQLKSSSAMPITDQSSITNGQKEWLEFYQRQLANWKSYLRLRIVRVLPAIDEDVPKVVFEMEMINYLPVQIKLVRVTNSSGSVSAGDSGSCNLPAFPETIDKRINASSENQFSLQMEVGRTNLPDFLRPKLSELPGKLLQWTLKGEWYVEVDGETEVWETKSYLLTYNQVIERHYFVEKRGY